MWRDVCRGIIAVRDAEWAAQAAAMAAAFGPAPTLEAAAAAIRGWHIGRGDLPTLFRALLQPGVPLPVPKALLLMSWGHSPEGRLRADQPRKDPAAAEAAAAGAEAAAPGEAGGTAGAPAALAVPPGGWVPRKQYVHRFLAAYHGSVPLEQAMALFGHCRGVSGTYLQEQYRHGFAGQRARSD